ncbi:MAG: NifB/NifX family molybdenum-iron cluster-binding protein [Desulfobacterales bacterium]|jgi:predicted Fe-Mo cluster-binding NifX family protein
MKLTVSSSGKDLNSQLDPRFGRCAYFLVINPDDMSFEVFNNESAVLGGGAGIQSAQFLASKGVDAVITGNCGPNAAQTLTAAGIELFAGQTGTVKAVVERFKKGQLRPTSEATVDSHFGMAPGAGSGPGQGMGGGRGMGQGMGGGRGMGRGMGGSRGMGQGTGGGRAIGGGGGLSGQSTSTKKGSGSVSNDSELETLKKKADEINKQLEDIITRINKLETKD